MCDVLQKQLRLLRRVQHICLGAHGDRILAGIWRHSIQAAYSKLLKLLPCLVSTHQAIRAGVEANIARHAWGAIQRAHDIANHLGSRTVGAFAATRNTCLSSGEGAAQHPPLVWLTCCCIIVACQTSRAALTTSLTKGMSCLDLH